MDFFLQLLFEVYLNIVEDFSKYRVTGIALVSAGGTLLVVQIALTVVVIVRETRKYKKNKEKKIPY